LYYLIWQIDSRSHSHPFPAVSNHLHPFAVIRIAPNNFPPWFFTVVYGTKLIKLTRLESFLREKLSHITK
jgi:hypothetical protein